MTWYNWIFLNIGKEIKYNEIPLENLKSMPLGVYQIYEYMVHSGKNSIPFTHDVKNLTGQNGTLEQFVIDHKKEIESDWFNIILFVHEE